MEKKKKIHGMFCMHCTLWLRVVQAIGDLSLIVSFVYVLSRTALHPFPQNT